MSKLRMAGLILVVLGLLLCFIFPVAREYNEFLLLPERRTNILLLALGHAGPIYLVLAINLVWPRRGAIPAIALSFCTMLAATLAIVTSVDLSVFNTFTRATGILKELVFWVSPYLLSLTGSLMALISARRKGTELPSRRELAAPKTGVLRTVGLIAICLAGMAQIFYSTVMSMLGGDSGPVANFFTGLVMGFIYGGPVLLMALAVKRFPRTGGILAVTASLGLLLFSIARIMNSAPNYDRIANLIVFPFR